MEQAILEQNQDEDRGYGFGFVFGPAALLLLALLAMGLGWTSLGGFYKSDESARFAQLAGQSVMQGKTPLWDGIVFPGTPILGNEQVGAFYPINLIHGLFPLRFRNHELSGVWGFFFAGSLQLFIAGIGAWWLGKKNALSDAACLAAGMIAMFCGSQWIYLDHPYGQAACWAPLGLALVHSLFRGGLGSSVGLGIVTALAILAGRADAGLAFILLMALMAICLKPNAGMILRWLLAMILGLMLSGVQWVTFVEFARDWGVDAFRDGRSGRGFQSLRTLAGLFLPLGEHSSGYAGYTAMILAGVGLFSGSKCLKWAALGLLAAGLSISGIFERLIQAKIGFSWNFAPVLLAGVGTAIAILAGMGLDLLSRAPAARASDRYMAPVACAVVFFVMTLVLCGGYVLDRSGKIDLQTFKGAWGVLGARGVWMVLALHAAAAGVAWGCVRVRPMWSWWMLIIALEGVGAVTLSGVLTKGPLEPVPSDALVMNRVIEAYKQYGRALDEGLPSESPIGAQVDKVEVFPQRKLADDFQHALKLMSSVEPDAGKTLWVERPASLPAPEREIFQKKEGANVLEKPKFVRVRNSEDENRSVALGAPIATVVGDRISGSYGVAIKGGGRGQWLLVGEVFSPGWRATQVYSSGRVLDLLIYPGNGILQAIGLDDRDNGTTGGGEKADKLLKEIQTQGQYGVWLEFSPRGWRHGRLMSLAGAVLGLMIIAGGLSGAAGRNEQ